MIRSRSAFGIQVVAFDGLVPSLGDVIDHAFQRSPQNVFVCILRPGQAPDSVKHFWVNTIQPRFPNANLMIFRGEQRESAEVLVEFVQVLKSQHREEEIDLLYLSDASGFMESRRLAKWLRELGERLDELAPGTVVRRI